MNAQRSFKDYLQSLMNVIMIFILLIDPIRTISLNLREDMFIYIPAQTNFESINDLQDKWFSEFKSSMRNKYQLSTAEYSFVFQATANMIGDQWINLNVEKREVHKVSAIKTRTMSNSLINIQTLQHYPYENLKDSQSSLRLAQAMHQTLHTQFDLVVNVKKLQQFILHETTQLSLSTQGLMIQSLECIESWCPSTCFEIVIDHRYIHDASLIAEEQWLDPLQEGVFVSDSNIDQKLPMLALTFDDGPRPISMKLIDILRESNTKATFFMIGLEVERYPNLVENVYNQGHEIGNHTYSHPHLPLLSFEEIHEEINRTDLLIEKTTGYKPTIMRPPFGQLTKENLDVFTHRVIKWNLDTLDWHHRDETVILESLKNAVDGDIILMHDVYEHTHRAVESFIQQQLSLGVQFVTVSQLIELKELETRVVHGVRTPYEDH